MLSFGFVFCEEAAPVLIFSPFFGWCSFAECVQAAQHTFTVTPSQITNTCGPLEQKVQHTLLWRCSVCFYLLTCVLVPVIWTCSWKCVLSVGQSFVIHAWILCMGSHWAGACTTTLSWLLNLKGEVSTWSREQQSFRLVCVESGGWLQQTAVADVSPAECARWARL